MVTVRTMSYNGNIVSVEDTATTARLLINGAEVDNLKVGQKLELSGFLPSGESVKVQIYGKLVGKFRLIIGNRIITENW